jgi:hypothetical protein
MSVLDSKARCRSIGISLVLAFVLLALAPSRARAQSVFITSAVADSGSGVLTIKGSTFVAGMRVFLFTNPIELSVLSLNAGQITTTWPSNVPAGTARWTS